MVTQQLQDFARQSVYDALSALFLQPEAKGAYENYVEAMRAAAGLAAELGTNAAPFEAVLDAPAPEPLELEREYARLFLGTCEGTVPLAESAWLHRDEIPLSQLECRKATPTPVLRPQASSACPKTISACSSAFSPS